MFDWIEVFYESQSSPQRPRNGLTRRGPTTPDSNHRRLTRRPAGHDQGDPSPGTSIGDPSVARQLQGTSPAPVRWDHLLGVRVGVVMLAGGPGRVKGATGRGDVGLARSDRQGWFGPDGLGGGVPVQVSEAAVC